MSGEKEPVQRDWKAFGGVMLRLAALMLLLFVMGYGTFWLRRNAIQH